MQVSIVIPVYNEGENILLTLEEIDKIKKYAEITILICYDFDDDNTLSSINSSKFKNILNMEPRNGLIWAEYGTVLTKLANYEEGRDAYLKALEFKPDSPRVHLSLGHVYKTMGEIDNSIDSYKNTILQNNLSGEA